MFRRNKGELPVVSVLLLILIVVSAGSIVAVIFYGAVNQGFFESEEMEQNTNQIKGTPEIEVSLSNFKKIYSPQGSYYESFDAFIIYTSGPTDQLYIFDIDVSFQGVKLDEFAEWEITGTNAIASIDSTTGEFLGYEQTKNSPRLYQVKLSDTHHTIARLPEERLTVEVTMGLNKGVPSHYYFSRHGDPVTLDQFVREYNVTLLGELEYPTNNGYGEQLPRYLLELAARDLNTYFETNYNTKLLNFIGNWTTTVTTVYGGGSPYIQSLATQNPTYPGDNFVIENSDLLINTEWLVNTNTISLTKRANDSSIPMLFYSGADRAERNDQYFPDDFIEEAFSEALTGVKQDIRTSHHCKIIYRYSDSDPTQIIGAYAICPSNVNNGQLWYNTHPDWSTTDPDLNLLKSGITFPTTVDSHMYTYPNIWPHEDFRTRGIVDSSRTDVAGFGKLTTSHYLDLGDNGHGYIRNVTDNPSSLLVLKHENKTKNTPAIITIPVKNHVMALGCPAQFDHFFVDYGYIPPSGSHATYINIQEYYDANWKSCSIMTRLLQNSLIYLLFGQKGYEVWLEEFNADPSNLISPQTQLSSSKNTQVELSFSDKGIEKLGVSIIHSSSIRLSEDSSEDSYLPEDWVTFMDERWLKQEALRYVSKSVF